MAYTITSTDKNLITSALIDMKVKIEVYDINSNIKIETIEGIVSSGRNSINAESEIRRTCSMTIIPDAKPNLTKYNLINIPQSSNVGINESGIIWLNKKIKVSIGIKDKFDIYHWYAQGIFVFTNASATYDATTNEISVECADMVSFLDGTRSGTLGQKKIEYPAYEEDKESGQPIKYNYIRDAIITTISQLGGIKNYNVEWIGEHKSMPGYKKGWDYMSYRETTKVLAEDGKYYYECFTIPFDQEFSSNTTVLNILTTLRDLYPDLYESYFDENGIFICKIKPTGDGDRIVLDDKFFEKIIISENLSVDFTEVKNVTEVWGKCFDPEWYTDKGVTYSNNVYYATIDKYTDQDHDDYYNGDEFALLIPSANQPGCSVSLNGLSPIPIYDDNMEEPIAANQMEAGVVYNFKIHKRYNLDSKSTEYKAYLMGKWEVHAMDVLSDGSHVLEQYKMPDGTYVEKYSREYFEEVYNCKNIYFTVVKDTPFSVQKLGVLLNVYTNDKIDSDSEGLSTARQQNYKKCRLTDKISITTKICPFADVNVKVKYKRSDRKKAEEYIVKSVAHEWESGTTSWELVKYYDEAIETNT